MTSAIHGEGFLDIMERVVAPYPETPEDDKAAKEIRIAIVGQPNAGNLLHYYLPFFSLFLLFLFLFVFYYLLTR